MFGTAGCEAQGRIFGLVYYFHRKDETLMAIHLKPVFDLGKKIFSAIKKKEHDQEREKFEHGKQQLLMLMVTESRSPAVCRCGYKPMPGTVEFEYCESLVRDGLLDREILTGGYFIRSAERGLELHRPC
jgi:hypothetical protein